MASSGYNLRSSVIRREPFVKFILPGGFQYNFDTLHALTEHIQKVAQQEDNIIRIFLWDSETNDINGNGEVSEADIARIVDHFPNIKEVSTPFDDYMAIIYYFDNKKVVKTGKSFY